MAYKLTKKKTPNCDKRMHKPTEIVIHHWGPKGQKFSAVVKWLCNVKSGVSAHYVVQSGKVCQLADPSEKITWHAGNWSHNKISIGIECRPEHTKGDQATLAELIADLWSVYGILPIKEHRQIVATACPGEYKASKVYDDAMDIYKHGSIVLPQKGYFTTGDEGHGVKMLQKFLNKHLKTKLVVDGEYGPKTAKVVRKFQKKYKLTVDGEWGTECQRQYRCLT